MVAWTAAGRTAVFISHARRRLDRVGLAPSRRSLGWSVMEAVLLGTVQTSSMDGNYARPPELMEPGSRVAGHPPGPGTKPGMPISEPGEPSRS